MCTKTCIPINQPLMVSQRATLALPARCWSCPLGPPHICHYFCLLLKIWKVHQSLSWKVLKSGTKTKDVKMGIIQDHSQSPVCLALSTSSPSQVRLTRIGSRTALLPRDPQVKPPAARDLLYLAPSPDFCHLDPENGIPGTAGRRCNGKKRLTRQQS